MKKVNIRQSFIDAVDQTDPSLMRFEGQMMKWATYIEKEIGSINGYPRAGKLYTVTGSTIVLPDNCLQVLRILAGDYEEDLNAYYRSANYNMIQTSTQVGYADGIDIDYVWIPANVTAIPEMFWEQIGNEVNLIATYTNQEVTVLYNHLEKNDQGYYIVNESHLDPITKYIKYNFANKNLWRTFKSEKLLRASSMEFTKDLRREYHVAIRNARAEDARETPFETEQY